MAKTTVSIEIPASADAVWQLMGGFDALPDWLPFIPKSVVTEGGRVRSLTTSDGGTVVERLEAFDNRQRSYTYSIIQAPFRWWITSPPLPFMKPPTARFPVWNGSVNSPR